MDVWATSNGRAGLKAEVLFDITYKVEWRSDLDFVRCVKQIYNLVLDVNGRKCQDNLWRVTGWQEVTWSRGVGGPALPPKKEHFNATSRKSSTSQRCFDRDYNMLQMHWKKTEKQDVFGHRRGL